MPSLYLMEGQSKFNESERSKGMMRKQTKATVTQLINLNEEPGSATEPAEVLDITLAEVPSCSKETEYDILKRKYQELQNENLLLKKKIDNHESQEIILHQQMSDLEKQLKQDGIDFKDKVKVAFKDFLTSNQIDILLKQKSRARWTQQELSKAFTLRL